MPIQEIEQAIERFKEGDPMGAIPVLEEAVRQIPSYVLAHVMLAQAYESTQQEEKAVRSWQRAHSLIPNSPIRSPLAPMEEADPDFADFLDHLQRIDRGELPSANSTDPPGAPGPTPVGEVPSPEVEGLIPRGKGGSVAVRGYAVKSIYGKGRTSHAAASPVVVGDPNAEPVFTGVPGGAVLSATDLVKRYGKRSVVKSISLDVRQGEIVGLLGPNGAGKTTTFYMIVGLVEPNAGAVSLDLTNLTKLPMYERARRGIGYLAQEASIFTQLTVEKNLEAVLEYQKLSKADRKQRVDDLIGEFGLHRVRKSKGYMLSGGERRRTEIARALATRPKFFLLDEPFAGVDPIAVEDIQAVVAGLKARGIGVLITDHNVHETLAIVDRAYLLYEGKILKQGTAEALVADEEVRRRYLGESFTLQRYQKT
jgi:lipopolysaccharide export system ATP-binding protein